jgi:hypothetical protein
MLFEGRSRRKSLQPSYILPIYLFFPINGRINSSVVSFYSDLRVVQMSPIECAVGTAF